MEDHFQGDKLCIKDVGLDFKQRRQLAKERAANQHKLEMLATLNARMNMEGRVLNEIAELETFQGQKEWNNKFIMKILIILTGSGLITGFDQGAISVTMVSPDVENNFSDDPQKFNRAMAAFVALGTFGSAIGALMAGIS